MTAPVEAPGPAARQRGTALASRLMLRTFPVIAVIVLLTQATIAWLEYEDRSAQLANRAQVVAELTAEALSRPLWTLDRATYSAQVEAAARDPAFRFARILDEQGRPVLTVGDPDVADSSLLLAVTEIAGPRDGEVIGHFELAMTQDELHATLLRQLTIGLAAFAVLVLGFVLASQVAVRRLVIRPLEEMLAAMGRVERKDWPRLDWSRRDELGRAGEAFDRMVEGLRSGDEAKRLLAALEKAQAELVEKNSEIESAHAQITESLTYARTIQEGLMPDAEELERSFAEAVLLWRPLQLVGGDHCWVVRQDGRCILFLADCTGHGVPGAFMTLIVAAALDQALRELERPDPAALLQAVDGLVRDHLSRAGGTEADDGLDAGCCIYDPARRELAFAGAQIPLLLLQDGEIELLRAARGSLGYRSLPAPRALEQKVIVVRPGLRCYLFTDGVTDQMADPAKPGGPRLFGRRRLADLLRQTGGLPLAAQVAALERALEEWRGCEAPRDDLTLVAFRPL